MIVGQLGPRNGPSKSGGIHGREFLQLWPHHDRRLAHSCANRLQSESPPILRNLTFALIRPAIAQELGSALDRFDPAAVDGTKPERGAEGRCWSR